MEALFTGAKGSEALLEQLFADRTPPLEALSRLAAFHQGQPVGFVAFRERDVAVGDHHFPNPEDLRTLVGLLLVRARALFEAATGPGDDFFAAGFLLWGLCAVHPFDNGNGRAAVDFTQYVLMTRWMSTRPPLTDTKDLAGHLAPAFLQIEPRNDGSPEAFLHQLKTLAGIFEAATLEELKKIEGFRAIAQELAARVNQAP